MDSNPLIDVCPICKSSMIGKGKITGYGRMYPENSVLPSTIKSSKILAYICCNCGHILSMKVEKPDLFK